MTLKLRKLTSKGPHVVGAFFVSASRFCYSGFSPFFTQYFEISARFSDFFLAKIFLTSLCIPCIVRKFDYLTSYSYAALYARAPPLGLCGGALCTTV